MRILYVISGLGLGGVEKQLVDLLRRQDPSAIEPEVLALESGGEREPEVRALGIPVRILARRRLRYWSRVWGIARATRAFRPHLIHAFDPVADAYAVPAGRLTGVPVVGMFNATYIPGRVLPTVLRMVWPRMESIICNTFSGKRFLMEEYGLPEHRIIVMPNGLDFHLMDHPPGGVGSLRKELGIAHRRPLIGLVGKLSWDKDPRIFVEAAHQVHTVRPDAVFCVVGAYGSEEAEVRRMIRLHHMEDYFHLIPKRADAPWLCRELDIGVLSSRTEGLPNVLLEYMWWGKPCVTTDVGDCGRVVQDQVTGWVVPPKDPEAMAKALRMLLEHPGTASEMGRRGRRRVEEEYGMDTYVQEMAGLYGRLAAGR